jgi:hypothetical protein
MGGPEQALVLSISAGASELVIFTRRAGTHDCRTILQPVGQTLATEAVEEKPVQLGNVRV